MCDWTLGLSTATADRNLQLENMESVMQPYYVEIDVHSTSFHTLIEHALILSPPSTDISMRGLIDV